MNEYLEEAKEELKRVDHIIYVSLKYTRTVDIIRNALTRLISACEYMVHGILVHAQQQGDIKDIPKSPKEKIKLLAQLHPDDNKLARYLSFYTFSRDLMKAPYTRREEYRRHVTMIVELGKQTAEIDIDMLEDNFSKEAKEFMEYTEVLMGGVQA